MELEEIGEKKKFNIGNIINYKDLIGEYPVIFGIKIVSSIALIYVIIEFYSYHNPLDSLITKYVKMGVKDFKPVPKVFVMWGFLSGFMLYFFTIFKRKYKFLIFFLVLLSLGYYLANPALDCETGSKLIPSRDKDSGDILWKPVSCVYDNVAESEKRTNDLGMRLSNGIFGFLPFLGGYGIWKRKSWAIAGSIGLALIVGFLYSPNMCLDNFDTDYCGYEARADEKTWSEHLQGGIFIGLGFVIYIELSYSAIKYENYALQFKPAGLDQALLTDAQRKSVSKTLMTLFVSYLINLVVILVVTLTLAEIVINVNDYVSTSEGRIQDSIELQGPYGIVFTSLIFFMLLGFVRMFVGADYDTEQS